MFSSTKCPWCDKAKDLLKSQGIEYELVELDTLPQNKRDFVFEELVAMTKQKTVPNIFLKGNREISFKFKLNFNIIGQHVGGYDSISKLHQGNLLKNFAQPKNNNNDK